MNGTNDNGNPNGNMPNEDFMNTKDTYLLMRDSTASSRLTAQHYLWKDLLGFLARPDIPITNTDMKVADVATGNGIWLHDFARGKPSSVELHGFDISLDQVAPDAWLPENIQMHVWDLFQEPPAEFIGYFDVVHVRLITFVVKNNDPRPILENLTKLLKPGGYLQWDEADTMNCSINTIPGFSGSNLEALFSPLGGTDTWKTHLVDILNENGYQDTRRYSYQYQNDMYRFWTDLYMTMLKELADNAPKTPEAPRELDPKAVEESRLGAAVCVPNLVWVARKTLN